MFTKWTTMGHKQMLQYSVFSFILFSVSVYSFSFPVPKDDDGYAVYTEGTLINN